MAKKYSDLPGVWKMHDFMIVRSVKDQVVMKVRPSCHTGNAIESPLHTVDSSQPGSPTGCYHEHIRPIAAPHVMQMCHKYIPPDRWPSFNSTSILKPAITLGDVTISSTTQTSVSLSSVSRQPDQHSTGHGLPKPKKPRKCGTSGCDGSGHKNKKHWNVGHTTKSGCPRYRR